MQLEIAGCALLNVGCPTWSYAYLGLFVILLFLHEFERYVLNWALQK